jgi:uncharacterized protein
VSDAVVDVAAHTMSGPVTTIVERRVKAGRVDDYENWLRRLLADVAPLPGYLGAEIRRPAGNAQPQTFISVFRFATLDDLRSFETSDLRRRAMRDVDELVEADAAWSTRTGLELWFDDPPGTVEAKPVRWRMALLLGIVVYLLVLLFGRIAAAVIPGWPYPLRLGVVIAVEILLMTYALLPFLTRRLARWISPSNKHVPAQS